MRTSVSSGSDRRAFLGPQARRDPLEADGGYVDRDFCAGDVGHRAVPGLEVGMCGKRQRSDDFANESVDGRYRRSHQAAWPFARIYAAPRRIPRTKAASGGGASSDEFAYEVRMNAIIGRELRMERRTHDVALPYEDAVPVMRRERLDARPRAFDPRRTNEDRRERLGSERGDRE